MGNENRFRLFAKAFSKGAKVTLEPNGERPKDPKAVKGNRVRVAVKKDGRPVPNLTAMRPTFRLSRRCA
jgi:hypothetical protein